MTVCGYYALYNVHCVHVCGLWARSCGEESELIVRNL
jgi:hypothetical protein